MITTPADAAPEPTISATREAANRGDFNAFDKAATAERRGNPLPDVPAPAAEPVKADAAPVADVDKPEGVKPQLSRKEREQQDTNERIRRAVEAATADMRGELERIKATAPKADPAPKVDAAPAEAEPDPTDATKYPDGVYDPKYIKDLSAHVAKTAVKEAQAAAQTDAQARARATAQAERIKTRDAQFDARLADVTKADPTFHTKLSPDVAALRPRDALTDGEIVTPLNDVAEVILESDQPEALMLHLSQHPEILVKFSARDAQGRFVMTRARVLYDMGVLAGSLRASAGAPPPKKTITDAPPPAPVISSASTGTDPQAAALARGDFATFDKIEMQTKRAQRAGTS